MRPKVGEKERPTGKRPSKPPVKILGRLDSYQKELKVLAKESLAVLKDVEWGGVITRGDQLCPICISKDDDFGAQHQDNCTLFIIITKLEEALK